MDAERVLALLAVEFSGQTSASEVQVQNCTDDSAEVIVRFGAAEDALRTSPLDLRQTAAGARSRLVALVIAELVRLGPPQVAAEPVVEPNEEETATETGSGEVIVAVPPESAEVPEVITAVPAESVHETSDLGVPEQRSLEGAEDAADEDGVADDADVVPEDVSAEGAAESGRCEGWSRFGRGPCSWAITLSYGLAFHQLGLLGKARQGSVLHHQLRLIARWRFLFVGARVYGAGFPQDGPDGVAGVAGGATGLAGVEWWTRHWSKSVLAFRTGLEAGVQGFQHRGAFCVDFICDPASFAEPTVGAFTSVRFERAFGIIRGAVEVELGWSKGFRVDRSSQLVTGLGGPWFSLNVDLSIGRAE